MGEFHRPHTYPFHHPQGGPHGHGCQRLVFHGIGAFFRIHQTRGGRRYPGARGAYHGRPSYHYYKRHPRGSFTSTTTWRTGHFLRGPPGFKREGQLDHHPHGWTRFPSNFNLGHLVYVFRSVFPGCAQTWLQGPSRRSWVLPYFAGTCNNSVVLLLCVVVCTLSVARGCGGCWICTGGGIL